VNLDPVDLDALDQRATELSEQQAIARAEEISDLRKVLSSESGRRLVKRLLERAGVFRISFTPGDQGVTAFNEGNRNLGLWVMAMVVDHCPEFLQAVLKEKTK
jgi:hypothetical protein